MEANICWQRRKLTRTRMHIFKVVNEHPEEGADLVIELVEDDTEIEAVGKIFAELMDEDTKIEI